MRLHFTTRLLVLSSLTSLVGFAAVLSISGPEAPQGGGTPTPFVAATVCDQNNASTCVLGFPVYNIVSAQLNITPLGSQTQVQLSVTTNYPTVIPTGALPGGVPSVAFGGNGGGNPGGPTTPVTDPFGFANQFGMGDFLMSWGGNYYAVVLSAHDGFNVGDIYQADPNNKLSCVTGAACPGSSTDFMTSGQVMGPNVSPRPNVAVWLSPNSDPGAPNNPFCPTSVTNNKFCVEPVDIGTGSMSAASSGLPNAPYTVMDTFTVNQSNFLLGANPLLIQVSSYVCANGMLIGSPASGVPEPRWLALILPAFLFLGRRLARSRSVVL
jgi:hypothetical protein